MFRHPDYYKQLEKERKKEEQRKNKEEEQTKNKQKVDNGIKR